MWPGEFGKESVTLNLIGSRVSSGKHPIKRIHVPPAPNRDRNIVHRLVEAWHRRALFELQTADGIRDLDQWPGPNSADASSCDSNYGFCRAAQICGYGTASS